MCFKNRSNALTLIVDVKDSFKSSYKSKIYSEDSGKLAGFNEMFNVEIHEGSLSGHIYKNNEILF